MLQSSGRNGVPGCRWAAEQEISEQHPELLSHQGSSADGLKQRAHRGHTRHLAALSHGEPSGCKTCPTQGSCLSGVTSPGSRADACRCNEWRIRAHNGRGRTSLALCVCKGFWSSGGLKGAKLDFTLRIQKLEMKLFGVFVPFPLTHTISAIGKNYEEQFAFQLHPFPS